jgi:nucleolar protein 4
MALAKEDAEQKEKEKKTKEPKDSRNLFLSREGLVREGTQAAQVMQKKHVTQ